MRHNARGLGFLLLALAMLGGCSSAPEATKKAVVLDRIQGKVQLLDENGSAQDAALNAGGHSAYLWEGMRRYRLFLKTPVELVHGKHYIAEGIYAQKAIDEIGDPDGGKNGYPLQTSCTRVVRMAWPNTSFDAIEPTAALVRARAKRYPARPLFLVTRIQELDPQPAAPKEDPEDKLNEIKVPAEKQKAALIEGPTTLPAPFWEPKGGTVSCKLVIRSDGKIAELETGAQLCESVPWDKFKYQPPTQGGKPVRVSTEVEIKFDPRT